MKEIMEALSLLSFDLTFDANHKQISPSVKNVDSENLKVIENKVGVFEKELESLKQEELEFQKKMNEKYLKLQQKLTKEMFNLDAISEESLRDSRKEQIKIIDKLLKPIDNKIKEYGEK
jgi:thymidylate kinase